MDWQGRLEVGGAAGDVLESLLKVLRDAESAEGTIRLINRMLLLRVQRVIVQWGFGLTISLLHVIVSRAKA